MKKTVSFASVHMAVAFGVGWVMTGDMLVGGALALVEPLCNSVAYYFHEMAWSRRQGEMPAQTAPGAVIQSPIPGRSMAPRSMAQSEASLAA